VSFESRTVQIFVNRSRCSDAEILVAGLYYRSSVTSVCTKTER